MKYILLVLGLFVSGIGFSQKDKPKVTPTELSGKISPVTKNFLVLQHHGIADTVKIGSDGSFKMNINQSEANYYTIVIGKQSMNIYLLPADKLSITMNGNMPSNNPVFEGSSAPYCQFLVNQKTNDKLSAQYGRLGTLTPQAFLAESDSVIGKMKTFLDLESRKHKFITPFIETERASIDYIHANASLIYRYNFEQSGKTDLPQLIANASESGNLNNESMRFNEYYNGYTNNFINYMANVEYSKGTDKSYAKYAEYKVSEVCHRITSQKIRDAVFGPIMNQILQDAGAQDIRSAVSLFESCCNDEKLKAKVKGTLAVYASLYPGEMAPNAACYDTTGKQYHLSDFRGKVLYIDTWATWCGPCKREIPELKKLEAEYHGRNVAFVSVSTDQNVGQWESFIAKQEMTGLQLHQSENFDETISKLYMVNSIPRFIVIDEEGKIVSADAPRPSSGTQVREMLDKTLNN